MHLREAIAQQLADTSITSGYPDAPKAADEVLEVVKRFLLHNGASQVIIDMIEQEHMP